MARQTLERVQGLDDCSFAEEMGRNVEMEIKQRE